MKMIDHVVIHNFKSHLHSVVPFSSGTTALVGPSGAGKSTVLKAICLALYNEPSGDRYITHGEKLCYVEVHFANGEGMIKRIRGVDEDGNEVNDYEIHHSDGSIDRYTNFGTGPFAPVVAFHGMPKVNLFGRQESLNMFGQLAPPFFLSEKPTPRAEMMGKMGHTDVTDTAASNVASEARKRKTEEKSLRASIKEKDKEIESLSYLENAELELQNIIRDKELIDGKRSDLVRAATLSKKIQESLERREEIAKILSVEDSINQTIDDVENLSEKMKLVSGAMVIQRNLVEAVAKREKLSNLIDNIDMSKVSEELSQIDNLLQSMQKISSAKKVLLRLQSLQTEKEKSQEIIDNISDVDKILEQIDQCIVDCRKKCEIQNIYDKISGQVARKEKGEIITKQLEKEYTEKTERYQQLLIDGKRCPVCQSVIPDDFVIDAKSLI